VHQAGARVTAQYDLNICGIPKSLLAIASSNTFIQARAASCFPNTAQSTVYDYLNVGLSSGAE
jgi:hypothetical protein